MDLPFFECFVCANKYAAKCRASYRARVWVRASEDHSPAVWPAQAGPPSRDKGRRWLESAECRPPPPALE